MTSRRDVLRAFAGGAALPFLGLPRAALAESASELRFVFVFNPGGWDTTRVFTWQGDNPQVSTEVDAERRERGDLVWVDHALRPSVAGFMERHGDRLAVLNGLMVPSVTHVVCTQLMLTGASAAGPADWATTLAHELAGDAVLPHLVLGGPSYPGPLAASVARTGSNGQLDALLSGDLLRAVGLPTGGLSAPAESLVDRYLARRAGARVQAATSEAERALAETYQRSLSHAVALKDTRHTMNLAVGTDLGQQAGVAVEALSRGLCRCVTLVYTGAERGWDTHSDNDTDQSLLFDGLFQGLERLVALLDGTPGPDAARLSDQTVVVVLSEMGRTPQLNGGLGKDHWPYTSALLWGPGLRPGTLGAHDSNFNGSAINPRSGELDPAGLRVAPKSLGATLLALANIDPGEVLPGAPVLEALLA
jgi:uncharacterized protein (DUF1501 family)